jgi:hypothetical protein
MALITVFAVGYLRRWRWRRATPRLGSELLQLRPPPGSRGGGLRYVAAIPTDLSSVYTAQDLDRHKLRGGAEGTSRSDEPSERRVGIEQLLAESSPRHLVVTGEAGIGKSSLLKEIEERSWNWWLGATFGSSLKSAPYPGLLPLRIPASALVGESDIFKAFARRTGAVENSVAFREIEVILKERPPAGTDWLLMVDAVDEITTADEHSHVVELLIDAAKTISSANLRCRLIVTTRSFHDFTARSFMAADARLFRLNPFTENQLKTFLQRHHIPEKTGEISIAEREVALGRCEQFVEEMRGSGVLKLVCIPLLAQLTADQYFSSKNPGQVKWRRVDIYSKAVDDYLDKFDRVLEQNSSTIRGEVQGLLSKIDILFGDGLENPGKVKSRRREILRRFMEALSAHHLSNAQDPIIPVAHRILGLKLAAATSRTYLAVGALLEATGLIVDVHGQARFVHRTFAEFLGAASWDDRHGHDVGSWSKVLADPLSRSEAVFAFERMPTDRQFDLIRELSNDQWLLQASVLVAEGLCNEEDRDDIVERMLRLTPLHKASLSWWEAMTGIAFVPLAHDFLLEATEEYAQSMPRLAIRAASAIAPHSVNGQNQLRKFAEDKHVDARERIVAAVNLLGYDRSAALDSLRKITEHSPYGSIRLEAAREVAKAMDRSALQIFESLMADTHSLSELDQIKAAAYCAAYFPEPALIALKKHARNRNLSEANRVKAADYFAQFAIGDGSSILQDLVENKGLHPLTRVDAAASLVRYDRARGLEALDDLTFGWQGSVNADAKARGVVHLLEFNREETLAKLDAIVIPAKNPARPDPNSARILRHLAPHFPDGLAFEILIQEYTGYRRVSLVERAISQLSIDSANYFRALAELSKFAPDIAREILRERALIQGENDWEVRVSSAELLFDLDPDAGLSLMLEMASGGSYLNSSFYTSRSFGDQKEPWFPIEHAAIRACGSSTIQKSMAALIGVGDHEPTPLNLYGATVIYLCSPFSGETLIRSWQNDPVSSDGTPLHFVSVLAQYDLSVTDALRGMIKQSKLIA